MSIVLICLQIGISNFVLMFISVKCCLFYHAVNVNKWIIFQTQSMILLSVIMVTLFKGINFTATRSVWT